MKKLRTILAGVPAAPAIAAWLRLNVVSPVLIGPDSESAQWVEEVVRSAVDRAARCLCGMSTIEFLMRADIRIFAGCRVIRVALIPVLGTVMVASPVPAEAVCSQENLAQLWGTRRLGSNDFVRMARVSNQGTACRYDFLLPETAPRINDGWRAELTAKRRWKNGARTEQTLYLRVPSASGLWGHGTAILAQWHETMPADLQYRRPPLNLRWRGQGIAVTLWNDAVFEGRGIHGEGETIGHIMPVRPDLWYELKILADWRPAGTGQVLVQYRSCDPGHTCTRPWVGVARFEGGLGYERALDYYFKFGPYTVSKFENSLRADYVNAPDWLKIDGR